MPAFSGENSTRPACGMESGGGTTEAGAGHFSAGTMASPVAMESTLAWSSSIGMSTVVVCGDFAAALMSVPSLIGKGCK